MYENLTVKEISFGNKKIKIFESKFIRHRLKYFRSIESRMMYKGIRGQNISVDVVSLKKDLIELKSDINNGRFGDDLRDSVRENSITAHNLLLSYLESKQVVLNKLAVIKDKTNVSSLIKEFEDIVNKEENDSLNSLIEEWDKNLSVKI